MIYSNIELRILESSVVCHSE